MLSAHQRAQSPSQIRPPTPVRKKRQLYAASGLGATRNALLRMSGAPYTSRSSTLPLQPTRAPPFTRASHPMSTAPMLLRGRPSEATGARGV